MLIRVEIPVDAMGIDSLLRQVFETDYEANLVRQLRKKGLLTLGVVATNDDGKVIGYVGFTPVDVNGEDVQWVGLAPLAVAAEYQNKGIGTQLVYEGLDSLNEFGYGAVVVIGDPAYYQRFGFKLANDHQLRCSWPELQNNFMVYGLENDIIDKHTGLINYSAYFDTK
nr:N-acetyltransferase [uncultured Moellerella sp.]